MITYLPIAALVLSAAAALFGVMATAVRVRDNVDEFIGDLQRQGRWASFAAMSAAVATALQAIHQLLLFE